MKKLILMMCAGLLILGVLDWPLRAQAEYPSRAIDFIVPYAPGGGTDVVYRTVEKIASQYKLVPQPINIVNKPGGAGAVGKNFCLSRTADGYTFTCYDLNTLSQQIEGKVRWDYQKDYSYIARLAIDVNMIIVRADSSINNAKDLVEAIKKGGPKSISIGGGDVGGADHLATFELVRATKQQFNYVPFNGGGEVMLNILGGHVDVAWANPNECMGQLEAKQVKVVAICTEKRSPLLPNCPTMREQGYDVISVQPRAVVGKAGIPKEAVDFWVQTLDKVRKTPEWKNFMEANLLDEGWLVKEDFRKAVEADYKKVKVILDDIAKAK